MADAESVSLKHEVPVLIAATLIVASGVCVEKAQRWLLRWVSPNTVPVVHALFREVSLLGVVALMFFVADRSGLLRNLSLYHFGDPDEMGKLAQSVDLALFMSILAFLLLVVLLLLRAGRRTARRWYAHETAARYPAGLVATYDRLNRSLHSKTTDATIVLPVSATPTPTPTLTPEPAAPEACCGRGVRRPKCCASCRSGARPVALIVYRAMCRRCCHSRNSRAVPTGLEAEVQLEEAEERLVYAALRARFLVRPDDGKGPRVSAVTQTPKRRRRSIDFTLDELNNPDAIVTLSRDVDTWYRPRDTVHATQLVHKMWLGLDDGDKVGEPGDWMVSGDDGSISLVKPAEFAKLFEPVEGEPGRFRSTRRVLARCMGHSYVCRTASGKLKRGTPGSYLVQDLDGHGDAGDDEDGAVAQFVMTKLEFASSFESMVPDLAELVQSAEDTTSLLHLPLDFDFGLYLSTVYAKTVAHIVELDWPAWVAVQVILVTLWGIHVIVQKAVLTHIIVAGYVLALCTLGVWYKLRWARRMLTAMDAIRRFRNADPATTPAADAFASIGVSSWGLSASGGTSIGGSSAISGVTGRPTPTGWGEKRPAGGDSAKPPRARGKSEGLTSVSSFWSAPNSGPVRGPSLPRLRSITMGDSCSTDITGATRRSSVGVDDRLAVPVADAQNDLLDWRGRQRVVSPVQEGTAATASAGCSTPLDGDADDAKATAARSRTSSSVAAASAGSAADRDALAGSPTGAALHSRSLRHITGSSGRVPEGVMFIQPGSGRGLGALLDDFVDGSAPQPPRVGTTTVDYGHSVRGFVESSRVTGSNSLFAHTAAKVLAMKIRAQVRRATNQDVANLGAPDTLTKALDKPPFEQMRLRQRGFCASCCCCRGRGLWKPTSRQQQLLWCGSAGVRVTTVIIQLLLLLCSAFVSVSLTMLISEDGPCWIGHDKFPVLRCCMWTGAVAVPPTFIMIIIPSIVGMFAVITNVEEMVKPDAIREVIQTQYTTQAMRALRMLSALALNATHEYKRQQLSLRKLQSPTPRSARVRPQRSLSPKHSMVVMTPAVMTGAEAVYGERDSADYVRRRAEVLDVFGLFDRELKGYITVDNMRSLLKQLGVRHMTEELLLDMMKSLDLNGDGHIGFDVFFEWIARQDRKVSDDSATSSVTAFMFGLIDTDGVGFVTVDSLRHALSCLGAFVRYDDLTRMMLVFDTSDTGQLSLPDFKRLLKEQNKFNKWLM